MKLLERSITDRITILGKAFGEGGKEYFQPIKEIVVYDKAGVITAQVYPDPDCECDDIRAVIQQKIDEVNDTFPAAKQIVNLIIRDKEFEKTASKKIIRALVKD